MSDQKHSWESDREWVLKLLEEQCKDSEKLSEKFDKIIAEQNAQRVEIESMKVKSGLLGVLSGIFSNGVMEGIKRLLGG